MWDLLHAWREWLAGQDTAQLRVFGIVVLWWGRLGKTLEFLGGLTVVIDLLGRTRMEAVHTHLRNRRIRLVSTMRRWRTGRRRSARSVPAKLVHPPGLIAFHRIGAIALVVFAEIEYWDVTGSAAAQTLGKLSLVFVGWMLGVGFGEVAYVISLVLLNGLVGMTLHLLASSKAPAITKLTALHVTLRDWRAQLRARWQGEHVPATGPPKPPPPPPGDPAGLRAFVIAGAVVAGFLVFAAAHYEDTSPNNDPTPIFVVVVTIAVGVIIGGLLGAVGYLVCLLLLEGLVVTTLGNLKTRAGLETRLKWIGLTLFAVGFSMDLLSS
ncbi:hypothetical protein [Amycolatopsis thermophila]|uniref:Uncharacterized protein n=1 Tax=Amycolatopsis thermophila TaxID=206084 RepID=A0ABU0F6A2_9PSEU|nr:hypothetical protein [Amycolatopsis thermophila]MDQ0382641.1 hypothetical protein [Amycolatopsis thermophila]